MAKKAMVGMSRLIDWGGWYLTKSIRFCKKGHRVPACMDAGLSFPPKKCPECGCEFTVEFRSDSLPIPIKPMRYERKWKPVEAFDRNRYPLHNVRQRVRVPVFDVLAVPESMWRRA